MTYINIETLAVTLKLSHTPPLSFIKNQRNISCHTHISSQLLSNYYYDDVKWKIKHYINHACLHFLLHPAIFHIYTRPYQHKLWLLLPITTKNCNTCHTEKSCNNMLMWKLDFPRPYTKCKTVIFASSPFMLLLY